MTTGNEVAGLGRVGRYGAYSIIGRTGTMAAGLGAASPVFAFRWSPTTASLKAVVDRIRVSVASLGTGFTAGVGYIEAMAARSFTVVDYGGKAAPTTTSAVASGTGGTLATNTYFYNLTAIGAWGETVLSTERSAAVTGPTGSVTFTYGALAGTTAFRVWRGLVTSTYTEYQDDTDGSTFIDTGAGWISGTPGSMNTGGTGLTLTTNNAKLTTAFDGTELAQARISDTVAMVAGTRTLDAQPFAAVQFGVSTATNSVQLATTAIWEPGLQTRPLVLAADEGFVLRATVPATGTWQGTVHVDWREVK